MRSVAAVSPRLEPDGVHRRIDFGNAEDVFDLLADGRVRRDVDGLAPEARACASRSGFKSPTMTTEAPRRCAEYAAASPTGPAPATYTVEPVVTPAVTAP